MSEYKDNLINELYEEIRSEELACETCRDRMTSLCSECSVSIRIYELECHIRALIE